MQPDLTTPISANEHGSPNLPLLLFRWLAPARFATLLTDWAEADQNGLLTASFIFQSFAGVHDALASAISLGVNFLL
jgi:hypothetical protein